MSLASAVDLPRAWGEPLASATLKSTPSDFLVREALDFDFDGQGEHLYLHIRKCGLNTNDVLEQIEQQFNCGSVDIGVSGLKDKNAVTDQWFSVRTPMLIEDTSFKCVDKNIDTNQIVNAACDALSLSMGDFVVLESHRHSRKLRRGAHRHNRFIITLRDVSAIKAGANDAHAVCNDIDQRLEHISEKGFVNYFGPQRFGINQQNLVKAERYFANPKRKMSRVQRSLLISSARSLLFNRVCAERVTMSNWNTPLAGEPLLLEGSHSFFINDDTVSDAAERCLVKDIHPTGPLWGQGDSLAVSICEQIETSILEQYPSFTRGLEKAGLKQQRRALRAGVEQLQWHWQEPSVLTLDFNLLKGVYATSFLSEFVIN